MFSKGYVAFMAHFHCRVKPGTKPYQTPLKCVAYALHESFKEHLEWLQ